MTDRDERIELSNYFVMAAEHENMYDEYRLVMVWRQFVANNFNFSNNCKWNRCQTELDHLLWSAKIPGSIDFKLIFINPYLGLLHGGIEIYIRDTRNGGFGRPDLKNIVSEACQIQ